MSATGPVVFDPGVQAWLERYLSDHGGVAGSVHARQGDALLLRAAVNLPPQVVAAVVNVPRGKGMAGLALQRDSAVQTCNLKEDETGDVRPGAKAVNANAAVAIPIHDVEGNVRGVIGIAFLGERKIPEEELKQLTAAAERAPV